MHNEKQENTILKNERKIHEKRKEKTKDMVRRTEKKITCAIYQ